MRKSSTLIFLSKTSNIIFQDFSCIIFNFSFFSKLLSMMHIFLFFLSHLRIEVENSKHIEEIKKRNLMHFQWILHTSEELSMKVFGICKSFQSSSSWLHSSEIFCMSYGIQKCKHKYLIIKLSAFHRKLCLEGEVHVKLSWLLWKF